MPRLCMLLMLSCVWMTACTGGDSPSSSTTIPAADWSQIGETETYVYYADRGSIRKSDETVTMSDLFDYKTAQIIHAQWADGRVITGVIVFQAMWEAVGLGLLTKLSRLPFIEPLLYRAYLWFARNRLWLTGRAKNCPGNTCTTHPPNGARGEV